MEIFDVLSMLGALALFLYGMQLMSTGLTNLAGERSKGFLERWTGGKWKALFAGTAATAALQSSSAVTVLVVGFVNGGILRLGQAAGVIMGANIGTTITAWLFAGEAGGSGKTVVGALASVFAVLGVCLLFGSRREAQKNGAEALLGFSVLIFGMTAMERAAVPLAGSDGFGRFLTGFSDPLRGVAGGFLFTAALQSSSASVGILQALCESGRITYGTVIPVVMGMNIGTCVTALLASAGTTREAKCAALLNLYFNLSGAAVFWALFYLPAAVWRFRFLERPATSVGIALFHSAFNILSAVLLLPFSDVFVFLAQRTVKPFSDSNN